MCDRVGGGVLSYSCPAPASAPAPQLLINPFATLPHQYRTVHNNSVDVTNILKFEETLAAQMRECTSNLTPANFPCVCLAQWPSGPPPCV